MACLVCKAMLDCLAMNIEIRQAVTIRLPVDVWRRAKAAAGAEGVPVWLWLAKIIAAAAPLLKR